MQTMTTHSHDDRLRIGVVSYLNSKPLLEDLAELLPDAELRLDYPSRLADDLAAGRLDVALIPSVEYFRGDGYQIVSDACVAARGPVLSVKLYSRVEPGAIRSLALDTGSRTSAALARILLNERFGVQPELEPLAFGQTTQDTTADAVLLIGDRAMFPVEERFTITWDLGQEWFDWTGLPFVFALWAARPGLHTAVLEEALSEARDRGERSLHAIARREAPLLELPLATTIQYLTENLHYRLGSAERSGLRWFYELAVRNGLAPNNRRVGRVRESHHDPETELMGLEVSSLLSTIRHRRDAEQRER
jgi:chorismate dehydratase